MNRALRVRDFMTTELHTVQPDAEIMDAVQRLVDLNVSSLLVVDAAGTLLGILTERDCIDVALQAGYFDEAGGAVRNFMKAPALTVAPDTSMMDLALTFARSPLRRFPVLDGDRLVGLVSRRHVLRALVSGAWFARPGSASKKGVGR